tara:strand:+ start:158 stop:403 length:246 start_codon:yes stop_codon:yes gene_type:complete
MISRSCYDRNLINAYMKSLYGMRWWRLEDGTTYTHTESGAILSISKSPVGYLVERDGVTLEAQDQLIWEEALDLVRDWLPS